MDPLHPEYVPSIFDKNVLDGRKKRKVERYKRALTREKIKPLPRTKVEQEKEEQVSGESSDSESDVSVKLETTSTSTITNSQFTQTNDQ